MNIDGFELRALSNETNVEELYKIIGKLKNKHEEHRDSYPAEIVFMFNEKTKIKMAKYAPITIDDLSHFEGWNKTKLNKYGQKYIDEIIKYLQENGLKSPFEDVPINKRWIMVHVNSMNYNFPQIKERVDISFCNENFYGKLNMIVATGFIKVEMRKDDHFNQ